MSDLAGTVLGGRYALARRLGAGELAEVYRARDLALDRDVAVKVLRPELAAQPEARRRFLAEARRAAGIAHPNVVAVHDVSLDFDAEAAAGPTYFVMELAEGGTLKDRVRSGPLPAPRAAAVAAAVLDALAAAHARGIVHRDVKAGNVLLTPAGLVKVGDFGIAAEVDRAADGRPAAEVVATPHYCSPEQALGRPASPASDVYSLGVVLYEMLTGRLPFEADDPSEVLRQQVEAAPTPPRRLNPAIPAGLEAIVLRALAKDPSDRWPSADAMAEDLRRWQAAWSERTTRLEPVPPSPGASAGSIAAAAPRRRASDGRRRPGWAPLAALLALGLGVLALGSYQLLAARDEPPGTPATGPGSPAATTATPTPFRPRPGAAPPAASPAAFTPLPAPAAPAPTAPAPPPPPTATAVPAPPEPTPAMPATPSAPTATVPPPPSPTVELTVPALPSAAPAPPPPPTATAPARPPAPTSPARSTTAPAPPPSAASGDPADAIRAYFGALDRGDLAGAYGLTSAGFQQRYSRGAFDSWFAGLVARQVVSAVTVAQAAARAEVVAVIDAVDRERSGRVGQRQARERFWLVLEPGGWRIDDRRGE